MIDKPSLSMFITGIANFAVQYNYQAASIALIMMSASVCTSTTANCNLGKQAEWVSGTATASILVGSICGQLSMGYLGDVIGRSLALLTTVSLSALAAVLTSISSGSPEAIYAQIVVFRFFVGIGLGGIFPLAATKASEDGGNAASGKLDSYKATKSFFWQLPGAFTPWLFAYIFSRDPYLTVNLKWRLLFGLGALPLLMAVAGLLVEFHLFGTGSPKHANTKAPTTRTTLIPLVPESPDTSSDLSVFDRLKNPTIQRSLFVSGFIWFLFDVSSYGVSLISGQIIDEIAGTDDNVSSMSNLESISSKMMINIVVALFATMLAVVLVPILGMKKLQVISFALMTFFLLLFAALFAYLQSHSPTALYILYVLTYMSLNCGVNVTTYLLPAALFPKEIRTSFNGIAAAIAKCGAVVGAFSYIYIAEASSYSVIMWISSFLSALGAFLSYKYIDNRQLNSSTNDLPESGSFDDAIVSFIAGGYRASREESPRHSDNGGLGNLGINAKIASNSSDKSRISEIAMEGNPISASREETFAL